MSLTNHINTFNTRYEQLTEANKKLLGMMLETLEYTEKHPPMPDEKAS